MYAIIKTGGKQYKVSKGDRIRVECLTGESDSTVNFDKVLLLREEDQLAVGTPYLEDVVVSGKLLQSAKDDKIKVVKFKKRKRYTRCKGHRQAFSEVEIVAIKRAAAETEAATDAAPATETTAAAETAAATDAAAAETAAAAEAAAVTETKQSTKTEDMNHGT